MSDIPPQLPDDPAQSSFTGHVDQGPLGGLGSTIGDLAGGAANMLVPTTDRRGAGFGFGDLMSAFSEAGQNTALGGISMLDDVFHGEGSLTDKLFTTAMIGAGAAGAYKGIKNLTGGMGDGLMRAEESAAMRSTSDAAVGLGLEPRFTPATEVGQRMVAANPGLKPRTADILGAPDVNQAVGFVVGPHVAGNREHLATAAGIMGQYVDDLATVDPAERFDRAKLDFAKVDTIMGLGTGASGGVVRTTGPTAKQGGWSALNAEFHRLWGKFQDSPQDMLDTEKIQLNGMIRQLGDATRKIEQPDLVFDPVARINRIDFLPNGVGVGVHLPSWDSESALWDPVVRSARIGELNVRALAAEGLANINKLYEMGMADQEARLPGATMKPTLPRPLVKGSGWYPKAGVEIDDALVVFNRGVENRWVTKKVLTAAVSLTSEAEDWGGNVALAVSVLKTISADARIFDGNFQTWLRDGGYADAAAKTGLFEYKGTKKRLAANVALFGELHDAAKVGNQLSAKDLKKVLMLASMTPEEVFRTTLGRKQKSFYLNLLGDTTALTIDRHMHDAFLGLASGSDFKLLEVADLGESVYQIIADTVRQVADAHGTNGPQVQGVAWEVWKALKEAHKDTRGDPWGDGNPFRLPAADGSENVVFRALKGDWGSNVNSVLDSVDSGMPTVVGTASRGLYATDDQMLSVFARPDQTTLRDLRHMHPVFTHDNGVAQWDRSRARQVLDLEAHKAKLDSILDGHHVETSGPGAWLGGHPTTQPGHYVFVDIPAGKTPTGLREHGQVIDPGQRLLVEQPVTAGRTQPPPGLNESGLDEFVKARQKLERANPTDKHGNKFNDMLSPIEPGKLQHHQLWLADKGKAGFAISPDGDLQQVFSWGKTDRLSGDLVEFAITQGARTLDYFDTGDGLPKFYARYGFKEVGRDAWNPDFDVPLHRPTGPPVIYMALDADTARLGRSVQRVAVRVPYDKATDMADIANRIEEAGYHVSSVHSSTPMGEGWTAARDHTYTDGQQTMVVRTADKEQLSYNGTSSWVPDSDAKGLAKANPDSALIRKDVQISPLGPGRFSIGNHAVLTLPPDVTPLNDLTKIRSGGKKVTAIGVNLLGQVGELVPVFGGEAPAFDVLIEVKEGRLVINTESPGGTGDLSQGTVDLRNTSRALSLLGDVGLDPSKVQVNAGGEAVRANLLAPRSTPKMATLITGERVPALQASRSPLPHWRDQYGVDMDPEWHTSSGQRMRIPDTYVKGFDDVFKTWFDDPTRREMARLVNLKSLGVSSELPESFKGDAATAWFSRGQGSSAIVLHGPSWQDPVALAAQRTAEMGPQGVGKAATTTWLQPNMPNSPSAWVAHELGHLFHDAVRDSFRTKGGIISMANNTAWEKWEKGTVLKIFKSMKKDEIDRALSGYGSTDFREFVAEAVAEAVFSPAPRALALQIHGMLIEQFNKNREYKVKAGWAA